MRFTSSEESLLAQVTVGTRLPAGTDVLPPIRLVFTFAKSPAPDDRNDLNGIMISLSRRTGGRLWDTTRRVGDTRPGERIGKSADDGRSEGAVYGRAVRLERFKTV